MKRPSFGVKTRPCNAENSSLVISPTGYGAHVLIRCATAQIHAVEVFRCGATNVLGRYGVHFHHSNNCDNGKCSVTAASVQRRLPHPQRICSCKGAPAAYDRPARTTTMLSDANPRDDRRSRRDTFGVAVAIAGPCTESSQKRAPGRTVTFVSGSPSS